MATTRKRAAASKGTSKRSATKSGTKRGAAKKGALKDPKGGLTAAGRARFKQTEGANLKPGVRGAADTPEKMRRKGSFLRRHFANPRGPMVDDDGQPTRLALSAHAWGEPVPKTPEAAKKLAAKGTRLLERYSAAKQGAKKTGAKKTTAKKTGATKRGATKRGARAKE